MNYFLVDTNVPLAANGFAEHAPAACRRACILKLLDIQERRGIILDICRLIIKEYLKYNPHGTPRGLGDLFMVWAIENPANPSRCLVANITPCDGQRIDPDRNADDPDFEEFPDDPALTDFDRKDRKFVAAAIASNVDPLIINATDTDWRIHQKQLEAHGIRVEQLCL